jgi:hypothetical protein
VAAIDRFRRVTGYGILRLLRRFFRFFRFFRDALRLGAR